MKKRVWLNLITGEFSNSWISFLDKYLEEVVEREKEIMAEKGWKLIEYECINDPLFELYEGMQIFTSTRLKAK